MIDHLQVLDHASVAIRNQALRNTGAVVDGDRRLLALIGQIANDNASERIAKIAQALERRRIELKRVDFHSLVVNRFDAVVSTLQIGMHRGVGKCGIRVSGSFPGLLLPLFIRTICLLVNVRNLAVGGTSTISTLTKLRLRRLGVNRNFPAINRFVQIDVIGYRNELGSLGYGIGITVGAAACCEFRHALVNLDFVVFNVVIVHPARFHIREIAAKLRGIRICRYCAIRYKTGFGLIGILVVVPELLAGVLALRVNLATKRDLAVILVSFNKRIHRRARLAFAIPEALE